MMGIFTTEAQRYGGKQHQINIFLCDDFACVLEPRRSPSGSKQSILSFSVPPCLRGEYPAREEHSRP